MNNEVIKEPMAEPGKEKKKSSLAFRIMKYVIAAVLLVVLAYFGFTCEVREGDCAVIMRFGAVREEVTEAGLYFRLPWPFESVVTYDNRLQYLDSDYLETTTNDKRNVILQSYVVWKIDDPILYHNSVGSQGSVDTYIKDQVFSATNSVLGAYNLTALVSLETEQIKTEQIQNEIFTRVRDNCRTNYGIAVTDVSILRISLPDANLTSVFEQMRTERQGAIDRIINEATTAAQAIRDTADQNKAEIESAGETEAGAIRAQTETEIARIYADAQAANLELYQFLKNLETMASSVGESTVLVVKADEYPFNILQKYGEFLTDESDETIVKDLSHILTQLDEPDRTALIEAISDLIEAATPQEGGGA